jgi:predicted amidophosphoribosyltransferase
MILDALFPKRCAGCGSGSWPFCSSCRDAIVALVPPWCVRCAAPSTRSRDGCRHCPPVPIASARAPFLFDGPVRRAVHRLKFAGWRPVAEALGLAMAHVLEAEVDVVTWVPLSKARRSQRGYDQALGLAKVVARSRGLPLVPLLVRVGDPPVSQARRTGAERRLAMRGLFEPRARPPSRVLLVDDVLTTGATAGACAEQLVAAGAREVSLLTAARAASGAMADLYSARCSRPGLWLPGERLPGSRSQPRAKRPT